jgi:hypothetical protein
VPAQCQRRQAAAAPEDEGGKEEAAPRAAQQAAQRAEEQVSPSECWLELMQDESVRSGVSEYAKLAEIALVGVSTGSVLGIIRLPRLPVRNCIKAQNEKKTLDATLPSGLFD